MAKTKSVDYFKFDEKLLKSHWTEILDCIKCGSKLEGTDESRHCENPSCAANPKRAGKSNVQKD